MQDEETERPESPFLNHVRFSPSAKLSSPARSRELKQLTPGSKSNGYLRQRVSRAAADVARIRLQNVPSEDEQYEFNRRYSRELRQRKGNEKIIAGPILFNDRILIGTHQFPPITNKYLFRRCKKEIIS